ncbi:HAD-IA family hydrolase [bacterium]|nr:HAD-IA family hydrolase [bacterium]
MKKHIVFDFDDTIAPTYKTNQQLFYETLRPHGENIDEAYVKSLHKSQRGASIKDLFETVVNEFGLNVKVDALLSKNEEMQKDNALDMAAFTGVRPFLSYLKNKNKIVSICTNRSRGSLDIILNKNNLFDYFDNIISCFDLGFEKPNPKCLIDLMSKYPDIKKEEYIYIGDSETDTHFAANAGIDFIIVDQYFNNGAFFDLILQLFVE